VAIAKNVAWMTLITILFGAGISLVDIAGIDYGHYAKELDKDAKKMTSTDMAITF